MIDFNQVEVATTINSEFILSKLDDIQIFYFYFGKFELGKVYPSKFRRDTHYSTGFYINKNGKLIYNDLTTGEKLDSIGFVGKLFGLNFKNACIRVASDFGLIKTKAMPMAQKILDSTIEFDKEIKKNTVIQFIPSSWQSSHIKYWNQYEISVSELKREEVYPVKKLFINKSQIYNLDDLCFAYVVREKTESKENIYTKIYQPYRTGQGKWISNIPLTVPFGLNTLKYGTDKVIVCKAQKDRIVLLKLFESVIGTQNESTSALQDDLVKHLCFHFPERVIIWDNDETGVKNCIEFNSKGFGYFNIPKEFLEKGIKDASDYVKEFGIDKLKQLLINKNIL